MSANVNSYGVMGFLIYCLGSGVEELIEHILKGISINSDLRDEDIVYDSSFIHYIRLIVLTLVLLLLGIILLVFVVAIFLAVALPRMMRH